MAPKSVKSIRNPELIPGVLKCSRSQMYHKRGLWAIKAKNGGKFPQHEKAAAAPAAEEKPPKFYPADDIKKPLSNTRKAKPTKLRLPCFHFFSYFYFSVDFYGFFWLNLTLICVLLYAERASLPGQC